MSGTAAPPALATGDRAARVLERLHAVHPAGHDLTLDRIANVLHRLGDPHLALPPVLHVAGTNGKGSTVAAMRAILEADGKAVHVHTSPHLVHWHERFRIGRAGGGRLVEDDALADALLRVERANNGAAITVFEIVTAAAFLLFAESPADAAIVEVGLGGRFDATNVIRAPAAAAVSAIGLDHQQWLGETHAAIAREKAGIFKRGRPAVIGHQPRSAARDTLIGEAERRGALPVVAYGTDFMAHAEHGRMAWQTMGDGLAGGERDGGRLMDLPLPALAGRHQIANAALAIATLRAAGMLPGERAVAEGLRRIDWPGRMQPMPPGPLRALLPGDAEVWLDGGHNPSAAHAVAEALAGLEERRSRPLMLVAGLLTTKDAKRWFEAFSGLAAQAYTVPVPGTEAGHDPAALAGLAAGAGVSACPMADIPAAFRRIAAASEGDAPRVLLGGSLYLVGEALRRNETPPA